MSGAAGWLIHNISYTLAVHLNNEGGERGGGGGKEVRGREAEQDMLVKRLESVKGRDSRAHFWTEGNKKASGWRQQSGSDDEQAEIMQVAHSCTNSEWAKKFVKVKLENLCFL